MELCHYTITVMKVGVGYSPHTSEGYRALDLYGTDVNQGQVCTFYSKRCLNEGARSDPRKKTWVQLLPPNVIIIIMMINK